MSTPTDAPLLTVPPAASRRMKRHLRRRARVRDAVGKSNGHRDYILRRVAKLPLMLLLVSIVVFGISRLGGSPAGIYLHPDMTPEQVAQIYERYNLNDSVIQQYLSWIGGVLRGDLGWSGVASQPVTDALRVKLPVTLELGFLAIIVTMICGIALGTYGGARRNGIGDHTTRVISTTGASLPEFWIALLALYLFYLVLGVAPIGRVDRAIFASIEHPTGFYTVDAFLASNWTAFKDALSHLWLPVCVLAYSGTAEIARIMRSSLVDEMGSDYVDAARAKGLPERLVVRRHARRNALIPTITMIGLAIGGIIQGTVVIELIFQQPGMGRWVTDAVLRGDQATIMAFVLVIGTGYLLINLFVDLAYAHFDRRIELGA